MTPDHRLEVVLAARDATQKAFKTATARVKGFTRQVVSMRSVMVGAAGAAGAGYFIKRQLESADATAKAADAIGLSTKALQEYRFIADRSGVATGTLEQGLGAFTKRLGELKSGTGALNTLLNKNNQALKEQLIQAGSTDEALRIYLDALGQIEDQSEKAALSAAGFSRTAGIKMTNMVKDGTAGLDQMRARFEELGGAIDDNLLRQSEAAVDAITDLQTSVTRNITAMAVQSAPEIEKLVGKMTDWVVKNDEFLAQDVPDKIAEIAGSLKGLVDTFNSLPDGVVGAAGTGIITRILTGSTPMGKAAAALVLINAQLDKVDLNIGSIKESGENLKEIWQATLAGESSWGFSERIAKAAEEAKKQQEAMQDFDLHGNIAKAAKEARDTANNVGEITVEAERLVKTLEPKTGKPDAISGAIDPDMLKSAKALIEDCGEASVEAGEQAETAAEAAQTAFERAAENIQDAWSTLISTALQGDLDNIENILDGLSSSLADTASNAIVSGFTSAFSESKGAGGGLMESLMSGLQGGLSTGNLAVAAGATGLSLLGGALGDDEPSWWDKFRDSMDALRDELNEQTEATKANTRAMLDASPGEEFRSWMGSTEGQGRSLLEEFRFLGPESGLLGRGEDQMMDFLQGQDLFGKEGEASLYKSFQKMAEGQMEDIWPQDLREQILQGTQGGELMGGGGGLGSVEISASEMRDMVQRVWDKMSNVNQELAQTALAKLEEMLARMQQELVATTQGLDEDLNSWADRLDTFRGASTEYDKMQQEYTDGVVADLSRIKDLAQTEGVDFEAIKADLFASLPYDSIEEMEQSVVRLGDAIDEHFNQRIADTIGEVSHYVGELTGEITPLEREMHALDQRFERWRESLVQSNASQEELNQLSDQRATAEEHLRQQYAESTDAAIEYANAMSRSAIQARQADIGGFSERFQLTSALQSLGMTDPSRGGIQSLISSVTGASAQEVRDMAASLGLSTEAYLDSVSVLDDAMDSLSQSTNDVADSSQRAADALRSQVDSLREQISAVESIEDLLNNLRGGGDLAPVQSMEFFENRYEQLLSQAQSGGQREVENLTQFARKYLDFAQDFGGYSGVASTVESDLEQLETSITNGRTLDDLYQQLTDTNIRLEDIIDSTRTTADRTLGVAEALGNSLQDIIDELGDVGGGGDGIGGGGGDGIGGGDTTPDWQEPWERAGVDMDLLLEDFKKGMEAGLEKIFPGIEFEKENYDIDMMSTPMGTMVRYLDKMGNVLGQLQFDNIEDITANMLWNLSQQDQAFEDFWGKYGFSDGGVVSGPSSGYTIPTTFHNTEYIIPEKKIDAIVERVAEKTMGQGDQGRPVYNVTLQVDRRQLGKIVIDEMKHNSELGKQIIKQVRAA